MTDTRLMLKICLPLTAVSVGLFAALVFSISINAQVFDYIIQGRVIDESGLPVKNAAVIVHPMVKQLAGDDLIVMTTPTDDFGRFNLKASAHQGQIWFLYVQDMITGTRNNHFPITAPFISLSRYNAEFRGYPVRFSSKKNINLGDVKVKFRYVDVNLVYRPKGNNLTEDEWKGLWYTLKDKRGREVTGSSIGPDISDIVNLDESELTIALPEGKWKVELRKFDYAHSKLYPGVVAETGYFEFRQGQRANQVMLMPQRFRARKR